MERSALVVVLTGLAAVPWLAAAEPTLNIAPLATVTASVRTESASRAVDGGLQPDCLVNSRTGNGLGDYATLGDQEVPLTAPDGLRETIDTHNDTWGYAIGIDERSEVSGSAAIRSP